MGAVVVIVRECIVLVELERMDAEGVGGSARGPRAWHRGAHQPELGQRDVRRRMQNHQHSPHRLTPPTPRVLPPVEQISESFNRDLAAVNFYFTEF